MRTESTATTGVHAARRHHGLRRGGLGLLVALAAMLLPSILTAQQGSGSIRGVVHDQDFDVPLADARVSIVETGQEAVTGDLGNYVLAGVAPGTYTLLFSKEGYVRHVRADVVVAAGELTDADASLAGEFTDMEGFVVEPTLQLGGGTEAGLLNLRFESAALIDSISSELMSRAGASDAASALRLVAGATVQDGKFAVIRGLPDRYVSSQMNSVRLPSADENTRAVELDQFPSPVIESIQVTKTFTPDQQGDASGGAVDVRLTSVPEENVFQIKSQVGYNSQVTGRDDFLTYDGGGVGTWGFDDGGRDPQLDRLGENWEGAAGVSLGDAPIDHKWSIAAGGRREIADGVRLGGFGSFFYERDSSYYDNGIDDQWWVEQPGGPMTPQIPQGSVGSGSFLTSLFDVTRGSQLVQWGGLGTIGIETDDHAVGLTYLYTHTAEDVATLAEDTRGKEYFFPGYDVDDPRGPGNTPNEIDSAPYLRTETLEYTERTASTAQLYGAHRLPLEGFLIFDRPELDWTVSHSEADLNQPDKRQFGSRWYAPSYNPGFPPFIDPFVSPPTHAPYKPAENINFGFFQRIFKEIEEKSDQYAANLRLPFEQWGGDRGYFGLGVFDDTVKREFTQETFTNVGDESTYEGGFDDFWSEVFPDQDHPIFESERDVDYDGRQDVFAWYTMADVPLLSTLNLVGGVRFESTQLEIVNKPESEATWLPPGSIDEIRLNPGDGDVSIDEDDVLPSVGLIYRPLEPVTLRASYGETIARPTFKELTPILQQEYLGGPLFIGNPELGLSAIKNYDLRVDYAPYEGSLLSLSWFYKDLTDPIENVQRVRPFTFTTAVNYPEGTIDGWEIEARQHLGRFSEQLEGLSLGANATFIDSEVTLPDDEAALFDQRGVEAPMSTRDATNAPEHLYNLYLTYDIEASGTQFAVFYTVRGDTLIAGAGTADNNFVPDVYAKEYGTLNATLSQKIGRFVQVQLQGKNLTNPEIETVYRSKYIGDDVVKTSYTSGIDVTLSVSIRFDI